MIDQKELLRYGNELTIKGFIAASSNGDTTRIVMFPKEIFGAQFMVIEPIEEEIHAIIRQLDVLEIDGQEVVNGKLQKVVLRKSQRNIDGRINWKVFRRDNFTCVYCGADDVPMTVDHIVLWEHMGDSVEDNMNCSCSKCNKKRGSMDYEDWLDSSYMSAKFTNLHNHDAADLVQLLSERGLKAKMLPLRKTKRSR